MIRRPWYRRLLIAAAAVAAVALASAQSDRGTQRQFVLMHMDGPIMPPTRDCFQRALDVAVRERAELLLIEMNTPGGHGEAMRQIAQEILNARVPVVVYVTPSGARAASAGAVIGITAHVLAMAPSTNIGAAHPVLGTGGDIPGDMRDKVVNDMSAFLRTVAERRGKSADWADSIVRKSVASTETEAHKAGVVDLIASDRDDLFRKLDGRKVKLGDGTERPLHTIGLRATEVEPTWVERLLLLLFDGNVTLILGAIAFYGIIAEVQNPGAIVPGVIGSIALVLSLYSMSVLSVNAAGVALLLLAAILFVVEVYAPTHGILTAGGITAFIFGSLMLFRDSSTGARVSIIVVLGLALFTAAFFIFVIGSVIKSRRMPPGTGPETLVGALGRAKTALDPEGSVLVEGALWRAVNVGMDPIAAGDSVLVKARDNLLLKVVRAEAPEAGPVYQSARSTE